MDRKGAGACWSQASRARFTSSGVTVAAASCLDANTASTAALVLGVDALAWLEQRGLHARLVARTGAVMVTSGWPVALECSA